MTPEEISRIVTSYIKQSHEGLEIENPKVDFKEKWYDLIAKREINEFLKDTTAIANTFGLDGFIIIGFNPKNKKYNDSLFTDSKLNDTSKIIDLINKKVDRLFDLNIYDLKIDTHKISVIHIPPSIEKPHVITNYQTFEKDGTIKKEEAHRIFVRKGTSTFPATKNDIELMFYDRKNIIPEYKIATFLHTETLHIWSGGPNVGPLKGIRAKLPFTFENLGRRPIAINEIKFQISINPDPNDNQKILFKSTSDYRRTNIIVHPNEIKNQTLLFDNIDARSSQDANHIIEKFMKNKQLIIITNFSLRLTDGKTLQSEIILTTE